MKIIALSKEWNFRYTAFINRFDGGMLWYSLKYKDFLEDILGVQSEYHLVTEGEEILAVWPLMLKDGKFGKVYNSLPFYGSHGGILSISEEATRLLISKMNQISRSAGTAVNMMVENPIEGNLIHPIYDLIDERIGQFTSLDHSDHIEESLMLSFHSKTRNMIRKSQKSGLTVSIDNDAFQFLETTHVENMLAINGKPKPHKFFSTVSKYFTPSIDYNIYMASKDGIPVAALLVLYYNKTVEYFTPVVKARFRTFQPLSLIIFHAMIDSAQRGFKLWNWGGTWRAQEGVYRFKSRFGAIDKPYRYFIKINNPDIYSAQKEELLAEYENFYTIPFERLNNAVS